MYILPPLLIILLVGFKIVRPTQRSLIESFGKYSAFAGRGNILTDEHQNRIVL